VFNKRAICVII